LLVVSSLRGRSLATSNWQLTTSSRHGAEEFAAEVRKQRKPEPYKGKGIRYEGEAVKIKAGKAFAGAGAK
jgi:large subunit ribosomal protein L6